MSNITAILDLCRASGLTLEAAGERIAVSPMERIPPGLIDQIREVKPALLEVLREQKRPGIDITDSIRGFQPRHGLPTTEAITRRWPTGKPTARPASRGGSVTAWLHVARQLLAGEFEGADRSTRESLVIGLRSIRHPLCIQALSRLSR